ncbi:MULTISPECIES: hypothetical protein [Persicobacter]|uniref:Uncharacterized protein n=1 Tax=Persicobacter diffluens TaxID=981 RepID=A0AAN4VZT4_9BACT|nr:hypothetical protein [Persicobacter sp. CCB-QB2]GJM62101.1 hypothetical protein PEDI_26530 [Persicobacter diffluens]
MQKYFPSDFNFPLWNMQQQCQESLILELVRFTRAFYYQQSNPLGLVDDTIASLQDCQQYHVEGLSEIYQLMAAIYRFQNTDNQLEFIFDGRSLEEKLQDDWKEAFHKMLFDLNLKTSFTRIILDYCILNKGKNAAALSTLKSTVLSFFKIKWSKKTGIALATA